MKQKPSEYLQNNPTPAKGIEAIAKHCGVSVIEALSELIEAQTESQARGGYPVEVLPLMWQWRAK